MVSYRDLHKEDVKARIRIAYGELTEFERQLGLPKNTVSDTLRGRPNATVGTIIDQFLNGELSPPARRYTAQGVGHIVAARSNSSAQ